MPRPLLALTAAVVAALGAGAVTSSAQTEPPADTGALAADCARPLPNPLNGTPATFLRLDGIKGESTNHQHWQESEVDQFRIGFGTPGGRRPLVLTKPYDKASPQLLARQLSGTPIRQLVLSQRKTAGVFLRYVLNDVTVLDVEHTGRVTVGGERLCLAFESGEVEYRTVNADGSLSLAGRTQF
jgi:type VI secretion system secreted protein Hcp